MLEENGMQQKIIEKIIELLQQLPDKDDQQAPVEQPPVEAEQSPLEKKPIL